MSNINKILITIVACVLIISVAAVSIVGILNSDKPEVTTTAAPSPSASQQDSTAAAAPSETQGTTEPAPTQKPTSASSAEASSTTAATGEIAGLLIGKWTDSAGMSGYEFLEGGRVNMTYVDLAQFGVPFDGKASGLYTLEGDTLTVKFSIYSATIKKAYRVKITENELSMYDLEDFETSTYARVVQ